MMIAIPEDEWVVFQRMSPRELSPVLEAARRCCRLIQEYRKQPRAVPQKPRPKRTSGAKARHVSTAKLLMRRKTELAKNRN